MVPQLINYVISVGYFSVPQFHYKIRLIIRILTLGAGVAALQVKPVPVALSYPLSSGLCLAAPLLIWLAANDLRKAVDNDPSVWAPAQTGKTG